MARCCATLRTVGSAALGVKRPENPNCDDMVANITASVSGYNFWLLLVSSRDQATCKRLLRAHVRHIEWQTAAMRDLQQGPALESTLNSACR